ncbi:MAG: hypothetical protein WAZ77_16190 [Candidatus Nitrosopolaris sp.]
MYVQAGEDSSGVHIIVKKDLMNLPNERQELQRYGREKCRKGFGVNDGPDLKWR